MSLLKNFLFLATATLFLLSGCKEEKDAAVDNSDAGVPENPRFELLSVEASGVDFINTVKEDFKNNIVTNAYLYNGGGVAVADFNNDGLQDIYFSATQGSNKLYLNEGNLKFKDITSSAGVGVADGYKTGVTAIDINADGWMDLYVCRTGLEPTENRRNQLFINNGDLTFTESAAAYGLSDISASNHANFFDFDKDGDLDVYVLNHPVDFQNVNRIFIKEEDGKTRPLMDPKTPYDSDRLFENNGNGTFSDITEKAGIINRAWGLSVTVSDFNNDDYPDVFIGNDYIEPDFLYINNKNGTFSDKSEEYFRHTANHTMGVDIADFNNDEKVDLVALDMIAEDNRRQKSLMTTMVLDRYLSLVQYGYGHQIMRNVLQVNNGNGSFSDIGTIAGISNTDWSWCALLADYDNDTWKDLFITNGYRRDVSDLDYLHYTVDSVNAAGGINPQKFPTFDDFLQIIPTETLQNYIFRNKGDLTFEKKSDEWGFFQKTYSNGAAYADLDNDGDLELLVNNLEAPAYIYKNTTRERGEGNYLQVKLKGKSPNINAIGAKIRITANEGQTQYLELTPTRGFFSSVEYISHFGLGNVETIAKVEVEFPGEKYLVVENVKANQRLVLNIEEAVPGRMPKDDKAAPVFAEAKDAGLNFVHKENDFNDFKREFLIPHKLSALGPYVSVGDVNGDGLEDCYVGGAANSSGALFLQKKNGSFEASKGQPWEEDAKYEDMESVFFDADGDKDLDLFIVSGDNASVKESPNYQDRLYINDGNGRFRKAADAIPGIYSSKACVEAFDYDNDGDIDLFIGGRVVPEAYPTAPRSVILANEGGKFKDVTATVCPAFADYGMITDIEWTDLDGDNTPEMILVGEWLPVSVFKNSGGKLTNVTEQFGLSKTNGWWNCITPADVDGDGDIDLVAGNLGLNTRMKASVDAPTYIYAKDFDKNGRIDPVIAWPQDGKWYPLPTRDMLIKQVASVKKRFVRYEPYAEATIEEVFPGQLDDALKLEARTFATTLYVNEGGKFVARELPHIVQLAPANQILVHDFNKDGHQDILFAGNNFNAEVETGRLDAGNGALLIGDGKGNFKELSNSKTGLWASKDVRDADLIKRADGKVLLVLTNNNDSLRTLTF